VSGSAAPTAGLTAERAPRRLRVALDVTAAARQTAGVGRYTRELARALLRRGAADYVLVVTDRLGEGGWRRLDLDVDRRAVRASVLPARAHTLLWHRLRLPLPADALSGRVDVYHAPDFLSPPLARARSVVTVHDLSFLRVPDRADPGLRQHLAARVPRAVRDAAHVLADSENSRRDVIELLGARPERVTVAYPGVGAAMAEPVDPGRRAATLARLGLPGPFVLGVGTIEPRKDWPTLIAAFERLAGQTHHDPPLSLVIAGADGWMTGPVHAAAEATPADVRLLGFVPDDELRVLYQAAAAFAFPSVYEGFGLPPLEAMACGVPTVVADAPCLPEVVGDAALTTPVGDADALAATLRRLLVDDGLRAELALRGPRRAARYTWDDCAAAAEAAYEAAAARS